ncbi:MAG: hypothetical protein M1820_003963 [Bogoriella megaspora]|nr:MAG: hypothetical protein M1820_003963 [Bogoriella megaspora]
MHAASLFSVLLLSTASFVAAEPIPSDAGIAKADDSIPSQLEKRVRGADAITWWDQNDKEHDSYTHTACQNTVKFGKGMTGSAVQKGEKVRSINVYKASGCKQADFIEMVVSGGKAKIHPPFHSFKFVLEQ